MIRRITDHNRLNGATVVTLEFVVVAAAAVLIGAGFGIHRHWLGVVLAAGTAANSLVVAGYAAAGWAGGERGGSLRDTLRPAGRARIRREHPDLLRDTMALSVAVVAPYVLLVLVVVERRRRPGR